MAMGIVSDEDFKNEITSLEPKPQIIHTNTSDRGRGNNKAVPDILKSVIAEEAINGTPAKVITEAFNISASSISAYKNDANSTASYHKPDQALREKNNKIRNAIVSRARSKILKAMHEITDEKLEKASLRDLSSVATAMANVSDKIAPHNDAQVNIDKLMIYAPRMRDEQSYDVIEVRE